jgi:ligand-binding SRPBCC domain-containing protein
MPVVTLETPIAAPPGIVFDLARSIDLHKISTVHTNEEAVAGKTTGLIAMDESVTWRAKHFGITQNLTSKITQYNRPHSFIDEMVKGSFKSFRHRHFFTCEGDITTMTDVFKYQSPLGILGKAADALFLKRYMQKLLIKRNRIIKQFAEGEVLYNQVLT